MFPEGATITVTKTTVAIPEVFYFRGEAIQAQMIPELIHLLATRHREAAPVQATASVDQAVTNQSSVHLLILFL